MLTAFPKNDKAKHLEAIHDCWLANSPYHVSLAGEAAQTELGFEPRFSALLDTLGDIVTVKAWPGYSGPFVSAVFEVLEPGQPTDRIYAAWLVKVVDRMGDQVKRGTATPSTPNTLSMLATISEVVREQGDLPPVGLPDQDVTSQQNPLLAAVMLAASHIMVRNVPYLPAQAATVAAISQGHLGSPVAFHVAWLQDIRTQAGDLLDAIRECQPAAAEGRAQ